MTYRAMILEDAGNWQRDTVRLALSGDRGGAGVSYLMQDGTWLLVADPSEVVENIGIEFPRGAVEAIAHAIADWQGHTSHADTEARVLRESLDKERERVDAILARGWGSQ